ncbi:hypothetical protein G7046_g9438 [Stylonectria norvegica]|nr:hypothetical protein G7046_g9438 [Stylonectria norvegica]
MKVVEVVVGVFVRSEDCLSDGPLEDRLRAISFVGAEFRGISTRYVDEQDIPDPREQWWIADADDEHHKYFMTECPPGIQCRAVESWWMTLAATNTLRKDVALVELSLLVDYGVENGSTILG